MGRRRIHRVEICLNEKEFSYLNKQMTASGLNCAIYLRALIMGREIKPRAPAEWPELVRQISGIGVNINQIARIANSERKISMEEIREVMQMQAAIWGKVRDL